MKGFLSSLIPDIVKLPLIWLGFLKKKQKVVSDFIGASKDEIEQEIDCILQLSDNQKYSEAPTSAVWPDPDLDNKYELEDLALEIRLNSTEDGLRNLNSDKTVRRIKQTRAVTGWSLKIAKKFVDKISLLT